MTDLQKYSETSEKKTPTSLISVTERCPLLGGNLKKTVTIGTKCFVRYSWHVLYMGCPLLGGFTVIMFFQN